MTKFKHFGVMLDCSRNAVMSVDAVKRFSKIINSFGYNTVMLYTEDTYEVKNEPLFGYMRGRYTKAEIKEIDDYLKSLNMELIPCIQTLAHFTNLVKLPAYHNVVDCNDILLIDNDRTYELLENIFSTLEENFTSRYVNIGMDEAHMVGLGRYLDEHGFNNRFDLILRHLNKVCGIAKKHGFTPIMWSDMFFRLASKGDYYKKDVHISEDVRKLVPESLELAYWDYYHINKEDYDGMIKSHKEFNRNIWFAGGAWCWDGFTPHNYFSLKTMTPAMLSVNENNIDNVLITMWGDNGKECSFFSLLPSLLKIRMLADGITDEELIKNKFFELIGIKYDDFLNLDLPSLRNEEAKNGYYEAISKVCLLQDPFMGVFDYQVANLDIDYNNISNILSRNENNKEYGYLFKEESLLCKVLAYKYKLGIKTRKAYKEHNLDELKNLALNDYSKTMELLKEFYTSFKELWDKENKPFGFEVQDIRIGGLLFRLEHCKNRLLDYANGKLDKIDELEQDIMKIGPTDLVQCNWYEGLASFSKLQ